jgi:hypothetical protein
MARPHAFAQPGADEGFLGAAEPDARLLIGERDDAVEGLDLRAALLCSNRQEALGCAC